MIEKYPIDPPTWEPEDRPEPPRWPSNDDCSHEWELRKLTCSNGAVQYKLQCLLCGQGSPAIAHSKLTQEQKDNAPAFDPDFQSPAIQQYYKEREEYLRAQDNADSEWQTWYQEYLASRTWQRRRDLVMVRDGRTCQACGGRASRVHHLTYKRVGQEPLFDLVAICDSCHRQLHKIGEV